MKMYSLTVVPNGHLEAWGSLPPPLIMRTAATPMPTPKNSPHLDTALSLLESRRGSSCSVEPQPGEQKSPVGPLDDGEPDSRGAGCPGGWAGAQAGSPPLPVQSPQLPLHPLGPGQRLEQPPLQPP